MPNLQKTFEILNDPQLVVRFQRICGVREVEVSKTKNGSTKSKPTQDGHTSPYNLRSRKSNSENGNYDKHLPDSDTGLTDKCSQEESDSGSQSVSDSEYEQRDKLYKVQIDHWSLYYLFSFGAALGNEVFYSTFLPYWFWNVDSFVIRRVLIIWCIMMYFGQCLKDVIRWPRPASPPVIRLEKRYELEYGMPSTHAIVGCAMPFTCFMLTIDRYEYSWTLGLLGSVTWTLLVCLSRLYLGMHSILDLLAGLGIVIVSLPALLPWLDTIDYFQIYHPYAPLVIIGLGLFGAICYPAMDRWSTARGDTTLIISVASGAAIGSWMNYQMGYITAADTPPPYLVITPDARWLGLMIMRMCIGSVVLVATRAIMKALTFHLVCYVFRVNKVDKESRQNIWIELAYKYLTYTMVSFNVVFLAPLVFRYLGIERITAFTEL
ncbi:unnamed protein product [Owenia fusiformis]|uniref:Uncharacterized protein n=1 Tax=Owenia fusiformis TaxID=6347 RepID=A0A8J1XW61_OWEFU|nr:unnamed protein product [Owenia fusiformis]